MNNIAVKIASTYFDVPLIRLNRLFPDVKINFKELGENFEQVAARYKNKN